MKISIVLEALTGSFETDMKRASKATEKAAKEMRENFEQSGKAIGLALSGAAIAVAALVKSSINNFDNLSKLSQKVGVTTESLSALQYQAGLAGVEIEGLQTGLVKFSKAITEAAGGGKQQSQIFKQMGIDLKDSNGNLKSTEKLLGEVADKFQGYGDSAAKTALAVALFGRAGADLIPLLNEGSKGIAAARKEAEEYAQIIGPGTAKQAEQFNDNLTRASKLATGFGNIIAAKLLPSLVGVTDQFNKAAKESGGMTDAADGVVTVLKTLARAAIIVKGSIEVLVNFLAAGTDILISFGSIAKSVAEGMGQAAAGAILSIKGDFAGADAAFAQSKKTFSTGWDEGAREIKAAMMAATSGVGDIITRNAALIDALDAPLKQVADRGKDFQDVIGGIGKYAGQAQAPILDLAGGAAKATENFAKLQEQIESGQQKLEAMANSITGQLDPESEVLAKFRNEIVKIGEAAQEQFDKIEKGRTAPGGSDAQAGEQSVAAQEALTLAYENLTAARDQDLAAIARERDIIGGLNADFKTQKEQIGLSRRELVQYQSASKAVADAQRAFAGSLKLTPKYLADIAKQARANAAALFDMGEKANAIDDILSEFGDKAFGDDLTSKIELMGEALQNALDPAVADRMARALQNMRTKQIQANIGAFIELGQAVVGGMKDAAEEGTRHYAALQVAQSALALAQGINGILNQASGDPYTAFGRMAAMAAVVIPLAAQLGASISAYGSSGYTDTAKQRQETQGTGTVLGDSKAKSESILNAVEITANASEQLVGINRGMLDALNTLVAGLGSAANMLARGAGTADFSGQNLAVGNSSFFSNSINDPFGFFGGSSKVTDEGIVIFGGALTDMLDTIAVSAYQEVQSRSWAFGSTHTNEGLSAVSDAFATQFQLVIGSIIDTVREGATALGLVPADIQAALDAFAVAEIRISLKDLSAEEAQKELQAVFSQLFDGLAGAVVPFIGQFQQVGEGLGETLIRVATEVQVMQEAVKYLGLTINETDPEKFAQISDSLIAMAGGVDQFIQQMTSFTNDFSSPAHQLEVATNELTSAFEQAGLTIPATRDGMFELMQTFDATTEEGRKQIATLLRLAGVANDYYSLSEAAVKRLKESLQDYLDLSADLQKELGEGAGFAAFRNQTENWVIDTSKQLNDLAIAGGRAGASEQDLVNVHRVAAQRIAQMIQKLKDAAQDLAVQLGYTTSADTLDSLNAQIDALSNVSSETATAIGSAVDSIREQMNLLLGDLSPFNDQKKLEIALQGLQDGTVDPQQVLEIGRRLYASTSAYTDLFNRVMSMATFGGGNIGATDTAVSQASSESGRTLQELIAARDALLASQRPGLADDLAHRLAELSYATGDSFDELATQMGFSLDQLGSDLTLDSEQLNKYLQSLADQFESQDFGAVGQMIQDAIANSADRIVEAITGEPLTAAIQSSEDRVAEIAAKQKASIEESNQKVADRIDALITTVVSTGQVNTAQVVEELNQTRRDLRETRLGVIGGGDNGRGIRIREQIR